MLFVDTLCGLYGFKKVLLWFLFVGIIGLQASEHDCKDLFLQLRNHPSLRNDRMMMQRLASCSLHHGKDQDFLIDAVWYRGAQSLVELFLQNGADPNKPDKKGQTAIKVATQSAAEHSNSHDLKPTIKLLMQYGGNVNKQYTVVRTVGDYGTQIYVATPRDNCSALIAEIEAEMAQEQLESKALAALMAELACTKSGKKNTGISVSTAGFLDDRTLFKK